MVWRRLLVRSDSTIADLVYTLQIAFGWSGAHLNRFRIHAKEYGDWHEGGIGFADDPVTVSSASFRFRPRERFPYEYDFGDSWLHEVRVERALRLDPKRSYPVCVAGKRATPPEDCGGPEAYVEDRGRLKYRAVFGEERAMFVDGCPRDWAALPRPAGPLTVGIDGGCIRRWDDKKTHFEAIVGKSLPEEGRGKCFGFIQTYDEKPKRRLFEMLRSQGLQMNQQLVFLSDGGDDVRDLQLCLSPEAEHYLDRCHITMRLSVLGQHAKGLGDDRQRGESLTIVERIKHFLWHGNVHRALEELGDLVCALDDEEPPGEAAKKRLKMFQVRSRSSL